VVLNDSAEGISGNEKKLTVSEKTTKDATGLGDIRVIRRALDTCGGDSDAAIVYLLEGGTEELLKDLENEGESTKHHKRNEVSSEKLKKSSNVTTASKHERLCSKDRKRLAKDAKRKAGKAKDTCTDFSSDADASDLAKGLGAIGI